MTGPAKVAVEPLTTSQSKVVVSGSTATFAGPVTVNGASGHRAVVTVTDRSSGDTFRLVVTNAAGTVVYDSGAQAVKGQLVIH